MRRVAEAARAHNRLPVRRDWLLQLLAADRLDLSTHLLHTMAVDTAALRNSVGSSAKEPDPWLDGGNAQFVYEEVGLVAREVGHDYIGTEHILLAFARAPKPAGDVLRAHGITWNAVLAAFNVIEWVKTPHGTA